MTSPYSPKGLVCRACEGGSGSGQLTNPALRGRRTGFKSDRSEWLRRRIDRLMVAPTAQAAGRGVSHVRTSTVSSREPRHTRIGVVQAGEAVDEHVGGSTRPVKATRQVGSHARNRKGRTKGRSLQRRFDRLAGPVEIRYASENQTAATAAEQENGYDK